MSLTDPKPFNREEVNMLAMGLSEGVQGWAPLPFVATELGTLNELYGGTLLLNDEFVDSAVEEKMKAEEFSIVHIASHGLVEADASKSFILTYDGKIDMDRGHTFVLKVIFQLGCLQRLHGVSCFDERLFGRRRRVATPRFFQEQVRHPIVKRRDQFLKGPFLAAVSNQQLITNRLQGAHRPPVRLQCLILSFQGFEQPGRLPLPPIEGLWS